MLIGLLYTVFVILALLLIFLILLQRSKGSLGIIGSVGSNAQMLFGGSGGQDFLKKLTWGLVVAFMAGSLLLALLSNWAYYRDSKYIQQLAETSAAAPVVPEAKEALPVVDTEPNATHAVPEPAQSSKPATA